MWLPQSRLVLTIVLVSRVRHMALDIHITSAHVYAAGQLVRPDSTKTETCDPVKVTQ
jgi:hypothetical protein